MALRFDPGTSSLDVCYEASDLEFIASSRVLCACIRFFHQSIEVRDKWLDMKVNYVREIGNPTLRFEPPVCLLAGKNARRSEILIARQLVFSTNSMVVVSFRLLC